MNKKIKTLLGILAFAVLIGAAYFAYERLRHLHDGTYFIYIPTESEEPLPSAPDFAIYDAYGNEVRLSDFKGQPVVLNFWATWCPSCGHESPYFENLYLEMSDEIKLLKVVLLDGVLETRSRVNTFMQEHNYTFPLYFDTTGEASRAYNVTHIPRTFFITPEGFIAARIYGAANEETLRHGIEAVGG